MHTPDIVIGNMLESGRNEFAKSSGNFLAAREQPNANAIIRTYKLGLTIKRSTDNANGYNKIKLK